MSSDKQHTLFETEPAPWDLDDADERLVAQVVFSAGPEQPFDYAVPARLAGQVEAGRRVRVPLGRGDRAVVGYCVAVESRRVVGRRLKDIREVVDQRRLLSPAMLRLTGWISDYYLCPWGQVLEAVVPSGVRAQAGTRLTTFLSVSPEVAGRVDQLQLPGKQRQVLAYLAGSPAPLTPAQLAQAARSTQAPITALRRKGLIQARSRRVQHQQRAEPLETREDNHRLNTDQQRALDAILDPLRAPRHQTILIDGITGSGKTEVYIRAIQEVVSFGRQAIVLVPEISLTPQTQQRFRARFGDVAVLHSHLTDSERHWHWERIARGEVAVVVGARSAVFAPTPRLGLIVLDEEHEASFKQETAPRYHARDVALRRAEAEGVPLVLGSATPSLESLYRAQQGVYRLVELPRRVLDRPLPDVLTVDLRHHQSGGGPQGALSRQLRAAMDDALRQGGQVILLLNRRGFATHIQCPACGLVMRCPNCEIALTHHRQQQVAICHYCDYTMPAPLKCPECRYPGIRYSGLGTQRLEAEVRAAFAEYPCLRMDADTMQAAGAHERALARFRAGEVRILLGTQMIAKGLDFPEVTLVGVVNADTALHLPDFRASERTCQLLVQVAGRTGRGEQGGRVLVQTFNPDHSAIKAAVRHDYRTFSSRELPIRQMLGYPPFGSMVRLVVRGPLEAVAEQFAAEVSSRVSAALGGPPARLLGPAPAPIARLRGLYRFHMQAQSPDGEHLRRAVRAAVSGLECPPDVQWIVDVDPLDML